ncbi:MAG: serine/threonine-protein kinase [Kofleriaceae bacterium]|nr:serine/threonine-protein kinase [Kofleriaceae bacterium]
MESVRDHIDDCHACGAALLALIQGSNRQAAPGDEPAPDVTLPTGTKIGRFTIVDVLGSGNMGTVFTAEDPRLERTVAIKVLRAGRVDDRHANRLQREAKAMAQVRHPNVVTVYEAGQDADVIYVAMERIVGPTLRAVLAKGAIPSARALDWLVQIAEGLAAVHAAGLVHRDVKPDNIFIEEGDDGRARAVLGDLGLAARDLDRATDASEASASVTTTHGVGTPAYMAPEQQRREPADRRADIFALGVTGWELVTGERPRSEDLDNAPGPELAAILRKAMAFAPEDRYRTATELAADLRHLQRGQRVLAHRYSVLGRMRLAVRAHRAVVIVSVIALTILVGAGVAAVGRILAEADRADVHVSSPSATAPTSRR